MSRVCCRNRMRETLYHGRSVGSGLRMIFRRLFLVQLPSPGTVTLALRTHSSTRGKLSIQKEHHAHPIGRRCALKAPPSSSLASSLSAASTTLRQFVFEDIGMNMGHEVVSDVIQMPMYKYT